MVEILFWTSVVFIAYAYFGYPFLLKLISLFRNRPVLKGRITPRVTFIITTHNEEDRIRQKLENTLALDYPRELLEVIVASDCSCDDTDAIVRSWRDRGVRLVRSPERKGKENAQKLAVDAAAGEILVFSDVATILRPEAVSTIVGNFNDPTVGCVSGTDRVLDAEGNVSGEGAYVRYEMYLRELETRVNTLVGLSGSFFAARKAVCREWATDLQSDFNTLLNSVRLGARGVIDPESEGYYKSLADEKKEYERKVRTVSRGISVFMRNLRFLNPLAYGMFSWQLFSHKLCRWMVPFALIAAFLGNVLLWNRGPLYAALLIAQATFYALAFLGLRFKRIADRRILRVATFFVLANCSILASWLRYLKGDRLVYWEPSVR